MGDRALIQIVRHNTSSNQEPEFSPVCYLHHAGCDAADYIRELSDRMVNRDGDCGYAFARLIGIAHNHTPGNMSLGAWNADGILKAEDTHGDAGIYIVDCTTWKVKAMGGYGKSFNAREDRELERALAEEALCQ